MTIPLHSQSFLSPAEASQPADATVAPRPPATEAMRQSAKAAELQRRLRQRFNRSAPVHDGHNEAQSCIGAALVESLCVHARLDSGGRVAEIGCGQAPLFEGLFAKFDLEQALAIDLAERLLAQARLDAMPEIARLQADGQRLPLQDGCIDLLVSSMAMHWYADPALAASEMARTLRPGGWLGLAVPLFPSLAQLGKRLEDLGLPARINPFWKADQWQDLFALEVVDFRLCHCTLPCRDTRQALAHIQGVGGNCLWRRDSMLAPPKLLPAGADLGRWKAARRQPLWRQPIEASFHAGIWVFRKPIGTDSS